MRIGVPKEIAPNERRVALTPDVAGRLTKGGFEVFKTHRPGLGLCQGCTLDAAEAIGATVVGNDALSLDEIFVSRIQG